MEWPNKKKSNVKNSSSKIRCLDLKSNAGSQNVGTKVSVLNIVKSEDYYNALLTPIGTFNQVWRRST